MWRVGHKIALCSMAFILIAILTLGGCRDTGSEIGENVTQEMMTSLEKDGPMTEYVIPDWEDAMRELVGDAKITIQGSPVLYSGGISQLVLDMSEGRAYQQVFSLETEGWTTIPKQESFQSAGEEYGWNGEVFSALDGNLYCFAYLEEGKARLASFASDGVGEISTDREILGEHLENNLLDLSGNLISYQNNGYRYDTSGEYSADVVYFDRNMKEQGRQRIAGWISGAIQADTQAPVYLYGYDEKQQPCLWTTDGSKNLLKGVEELDYLAAYAEDGTLCITDRSGIWVMEEGSVRELYHYGDHGYYPNTLYGMCRGEGQTLQILIECDNDLLLLTYDLTKQDVVVNKQELTVAFSMQNPGLKEVIARFNRQNTDYYVSIMLPEQGEDLETFRSRIQMELAAGRGPDMLGSDLFPDPDGLLRNGYLEYLDGQGFEEMGCVETALETRKTKDGLYGIPYDFSLDFAAYRESDVGDMSTLTMEQLMNKVRSSDVRILQRLLYNSQVVIKYVLWDRSNKDYIDWEAGVSHLSEEPFLEALEFVKEYTDQGDLGQNLDKEKIFAEGCFTGYTVRSVAGLNDYYDVLGTDMRVLGYPRKEGNGIYLDTNAIYVNSQSDNKEAAITFLKYLISEETQIRYIENDYWKEMESSGETLWQGNKAAFPVNRSAFEGLMDMNSCTENQRQQLFFLLENAQPAFDLGEVAVMVEEELAPFFGGSRSAQEAADILDKRVQLYLDENR